MVKEFKRLLEGLDAATSGSRVRIGGGRLSQAIEDL
jgi:hypothetical protein